MLTQPSTIPTVPSFDQEDQVDVGRDRATRTKLKVYLMDMWSFIPYYMAHLSKALQRESVDVTLGSVRYHLDRNYFRNAGVRSDPLLLDWGGKFGWNSLRRIVKSFEYILNLAVLGLRQSISRSSVLHVQFLPFLERGWPFEIWFLRWMHWRGVRIAYTVHNLADRDSRTHGKSLYAAAYQIAHAIICHDREAREKLIRDFGVPLAKIRIIPHGPLFAEEPAGSRDESRKKLGLPLDETLTLCAGVITRYKGILFLLDAWKRMKESGTQGRLLIAGTGEPGLLQQIRETVAAEHLESTVTLWLHFVPVDLLPYLYQAADVLVYPYQACTTSGALLTGLNYGKVFVTTTLPFFREHLVEGQEALMADYGDVDGFATALQQWISDPQRRERAGLKVIGRHSPEQQWRTIAGATAACYHELSEPSAQSISTNRPST
jgi:glycosyltransferase involved in cell wall biosynthesis